MAPRDPKEKEKLIKRMGRETGREIVKMIEGAGVPLESLTPREVDRLCSLVIEEGGNVLGKAAVEAKRLYARGKLTHAAAEEMTRKILKGACELAARRFLAGRVPRHGP